MKKVVLILWLLVLGNIGMKAEFRHIVRVIKKLLLSDKNLSKA